MSRYLGKRVAGLGYVLRQGPRVVGYRLCQRAAWEWQRQARSWPRLEQRVRSVWTEARAQRWRDGDLRPPPWLAADGLQAFQEWAADHPAWSESTVALAACTRAGAVTIFDQSHPIAWPQAPWNADPRHGYTWEPKYYRDYQHYAVRKSAPYDVKFPWELSRFGFAFPVLQAAILAGDASGAAWLAERLLEWEVANPCAYSVNWCAMECSMRVLALAQIVAALAAWKLTPTAALVPFLRQLSLQGEFLRSNLEVSRIPGNHYAANLAALAVAGAALGPAWPAARGWAAYARPRLLRQVQEQFLPDGVHFEKSVAYHRLVAEIFLLAMLACEHEAAWPEPARARLQAACGYTAAAARCDGLAANFGDNDGARVLAFDPWPLRDQRALLALGAVCFSSPQLRAAAVPSACVAWFTGRRGLKAWERLPAAPPQRFSIFPHGGMLAARGPGGYLLADFGEVGQRGLGGHGHNDLFSFEFCGPASPLIVDAGSPVYSGDLALQRHFRTTAAHNTTAVDGAEMAPLLGPWRISDAARPRNVQWRVHQDVIEISGEHTGFSSDQEVIVVSRRLRFDPVRGRLLCEDCCRCQRQHQFTQRFHFAPGLEVLLGEAEAAVRRGSDGLAQLRWDAGAKPRLIEDLVSDMYGQCARAATLELTRQAGPALAGPFTVEITAAP